MSKYVSLHNHTHFSLLNSLISPKDLFLRAKELGQSAVAVSDYGTLSGAWDVLKASKETGIKGIIGCEYYFVHDLNNRENERIRYIILLAKNINGYKNILHLNREAFDKPLILTKRIVPLIDWKLLEKYSSDVVCLTGCGNGIIANHINNLSFNEAEVDLKRLIDLFSDNLAVEIQAHNLNVGKTYYNDVVNQIHTNRQLINLANKFSLKVVPTTNSFYLKKEDAETHDVLLAIGSMQPTYSNARVKYPVHDFYLKSEEEIKTFFSRNYSEKFSEEICENTLYFADKCENAIWIDPKVSNPDGKELPVFPVETEKDFSVFKEWLGKQTDNIKKLDVDKAYLRFKCSENYNKIPGGKEKEYLDRLDEEFDVIEYHGFSSYMLIVADYISFAKKNEIRTGPGRGSCGGSLIAYLIGIHEADPIKYKLIFARFHNREKTSFPDIDTDFSPSGREKVQDYIRNKYGNDRVAHVSNVNTITPKVFSRDIARSCELGGNRKDAVKIGTSIADSIPREIKTIDEAFEKAPLFSEYSKEYAQLKKFSSICGKYRAWSTHAGGLVISKRPLNDFIPLRKDKDGSIAIEFDKERAEENGLIKMDTLGVETLDVIDKTLELIKKAGKIAPININPDEYDKETYDLISRGDTLCVFQLGTSSGTIDLCRKIKAKSIEDISHINSLARPSAKDIRADFIKTKEGSKKVKLLHPSLQRAFGDTYGFGLYEESLMYLAQDVAGWTLHEADRLRKLTKEKGKNPKRALQWRSEFIADAKKNKNIEENVAMKIWDDVIEKFSGYGFNMAHSITYSFISYQTAYLKAHFPIEFLLANLMSEVSSVNAKAAKGNIERIKQELKSHGIKIIPPNINTSQFAYTIVDDNNLLTGLDALKFVGDDAISDMISKRPFKNFDDFMVRVDSSKVRSNTIQALAASGALDCLGVSRKLIYLYCSDYRKKLAIWRKEKSLFKENFVYPWPTETDWSIVEKYALEKFYLGDAFICNKSDAYGDFFKKRYHENFNDVRNKEDRDVVPTMIAEIKNVYEFKVKKEGSKLLGRTMIKAIVEDENNEQCSLTIFPNQWDEVKNRLREASKNRVKFSEGIAIQFGGSVNFYEDEIGIVLTGLYDFCLPPALPKDLKAKSVAIKKPKKVKENSSKKDDDADDIINSLEDDLYNDGFIDLDNENDDD